MTQESSIKNERLGGLSVYQPSDKSVKSIRSPRQNKTRRFTAKRLNSSGSSAGNEVPAIEVGKIASFEVEALPDFATIGHNGCFQKTKLIGALSFILLFIYTLHALIGPLGVGLLFSIPFEEKTGCYIVDENNPSISASWIKSFACLIATSMIPYVVIAKQVPALRHSSNRRAIWASVLISISCIFAMLQMVQPNESVLPECAAFKFNESVPVYPSTGDCRVVEMQSLDPFWHRLCEFDYHTHIVVSDIFANTYQLNENQTRDLYKELTPILEAFQPVMWTLGEPVLEKAVCSLMFPPCTTECKPQLPCEDSVLKYVQSSLLKTHSITELERRFPMTYEAAFHSNCTNLPEWLEGKLPPIKSFKDFFRDLGMPVGLVDIFFDLVTGMKVNCTDFFRVIKQRSNFSTPDRSCYNTSAQNYALYVYKNDDKGTGSCSLKKWELVQARWRNYEASLNEHEQAYYSSMVNKQELWKKKHFTCLSIVYFLFLSLSSTVVMFAPAPSKIDMKDKNDLTFRRGSLQTQIRSAHSLRSAVCVGLLLVQWSCSLVLALIYFLPSKDVPKSYVYTVTLIAMLPLRKALSRVFLLESVRWKMTSEKTTPRSPLSKQLSRFTSSRLSMGKVGRAWEKTFTWYTWARKYYRDHYSITGDRYFLRVAFAETVEIILQCNTLLRSLDKVDFMVTTILAIVLCFNCTLTPIVMWKQKRDLVIVFDCIFDIAYVFINAYRIVHFDAKVTLMDQLSFIYPLCSVTNILSEYSRVVINENIERFQYASAAMFKVDARDLKVPARRASVVLRIPSHRAVPEKGTFWAKLVHVFQFSHAIVAFTSAFVAAFIIGTIFSQHATCREKFGTCTWRQVHPHIYFSGARPFYKGMQCRTDVVEHVDVAACTNLGDSFDEFKNLKVLTLGASLSMLPRSLVRLAATNNSVLERIEATQLPTRIDLSGFGLADVPKVILDMLQNNRGNPNLRQLDLSRNALTHGAIEQVTKALVKSESTSSLLRVVDISDNLLNRAPIGMLYGLKELMTVRAANNNISGIGSLAALFLKNKPGRSIDLAGNPVRRVDFQNGGLKTLPEEIYDLSSLEVLALWNNSIPGALPVKKLAKLTRLKMLGLSYNEFTGTVPVELAQITGLRVIDLSGNALKGTLPSELASLPLLALDIGDNDGLVAPAPYFENITDDIPWGHKHMYDPF